MVPESPGEPCFHATATSRILAMLFKYFPLTVLRFASGIKAIDSTL